MFDEVSQGVALRQDLNPIEHLWDDVERWLKNFFMCVKNFSKLRQNRNYGRTTYPQKNGRTDQFEGWMSGEYPAVFSGASVGNLEVPGVPAKNNLGWFLSSRVLAVLNSLAEFPWFKRSIITVSTEIWARKGSRFALFISSTIWGKTLHCSPHSRHSCLFLFLLSRLPHWRTFQLMRLNRTCSRFSMSYFCRKNSCNQRRGNLRFEPI